MKPATILALGSVNADFQVRLSAAPGSAETLLARDLTRLGGGKAANIAFVAQRLGHRGVLLAQIGDDDLAEQALAPLRQERVDLAAVHRRVDVPTAVSMITVGDDGKKHIVLANAANDAWSDQAVAHALRVIEHAPVPALLVADYEVPAPVVEAALRIAQERGIPAVVDPSFADRIRVERLDGLFAITPNVQEAEQLGGMTIRDETDAAGAVRALMQRGIRTVCLKHSDGGCLLGTAGGLTHLSAPPVEEVVDSTGAGDAFTAAFAVLSVEGKPPLQAAAFGVAASTLAVTGWGSQTAYPQRSRIEALLPEIFRHIKPVGEA